MKCVGVEISIIFAILLPAEATRGQTLLNTGDITIIGLHHDDFTGTGGPPKSIALVTWVDIAPATVISFTDNGWLSPEGVFRVSEGIANWTAGVAAAAGSVIILPGAMGNFNLSTGGDQVFAFQGSIDGAGALTGTLIFGINNNGAGVWQATASDSNTSALPTVLNVAGGNLALNEVDNAQYTGPRSNFANIASAKSAALNLANWSFSDTNQIGVLDGTAFTFSSGDYNQDGIVDAADYVVWRKTDGTQEGYDSWRANFGGLAGSGSVASADATVPEPTTLMMFIVAAVGIHLRRCNVASQAS
jgi:hypothetical protein